MIRKEDLSIIIVDDLQFSCEVVKSGLKKAGYRHIRTANSANEAMLQINQQRADVILADFWMPEMNGLELTDLIRQWDEKNNRYTGIILLTAEDAASSIVVAFDHCVDDFLSKSANQSELAARVYGTGRITRSQNELRQKNRDLTSRYQNYNQMSLLDSDTGLANRKQLERTLESMISQCGSRGGGIGLSLIRIYTDQTDSSQLKPLPKTTLRTISNSLQLAYRPMDHIARYDNFTFALALVYTNQIIFNPNVFERGIKNILKHTHQQSDQGKKLNLSIASWYSSQFEPTPEVSKILDNLEKNLKPVNSVKRRIKT